MRKILFPLLFLLLTTMCLYGQETTVATGGEASGAGGTVSYTIGQVFYTTNSSTGNSEAQGVQQPYEISIVLGIQKQEGISLTCHVYPNPSTTYLVLEVENYDLKDLHYQLYDVSGKLLKSKRIESTTSTINMIDYVPSAYLLQVVSESTTIQTFKIIKN
jgi:hypothetical protein